VELKNQIKLKHNKTIDVRTGDSGDLKKNMEKETCVHIWTLSRCELLSIDQSICELTAGTKKRNGVLL
jgi:hypothetical protein